jgi:serine/threonine-protein kinase
MGEIFLARLSGAEGFEKLYVIKRILPHLADDTRFRQMLIAEASIASRMSHANICHVYELGETDGQLYIVMEYLEGVSLLSTLRRASKAHAPLDLGLVAGVIQQTCDGLNYAHELRDRSGSYLGIIHRDVTPSNIYLLESGVAKLLDFGIAKAKGASTQTQEGTVKGKYAYMAPEQLRGGNIDRRVDIFALGVVLYEMLALRRLFQRNTDYLTFRAVMEQPIPDIRRYRPDITEPLAAVLMHALERDPATRFETARQFGSAVLDAMSPSRPWTQGEISDFVRHEFAEELGKRSHQVAGVVARTDVGRSTMPLLAHQDDGPSEHDDDEDGFPSVETEMAPAPSFTPQPAPPRAGASQDFAVGGTPPPFAGETTGSAPSLQPLTNAPGTQVVVVKQRSLVWPLLTIAMLAVAGGALFLVWQQMQKQQPAVVNITSTTTPIDDPGKSLTRDAHVVEPPPTIDAAVVPETPDAAVKITKRPKRPLDINDAVAQKKPELTACISDHMDKVPTGVFKAVVTLAASGQAKSVGFEPETVSTTPLGACLRNVLMHASYPAAPADNFQFKVPLHIGPT